LSIILASDAPRFADVSDYERAVLASEPLAYWRLGEAKGPRVIDKANNGHDGILCGTPSLQQLGAIMGDPDTAVMLDGKKSFIEIPSHPDFSQCTSRQGLTIEVWFRPDLLEFDGETHDPYIHWLAKGCPQHQEWALRFYSASSRYRSNRISAYIFNPIGGEGVGAYFQDKLIAGEWIHIVACFDPGNADNPWAGVSIYRDGHRRLGPPLKTTLYNNPPLRIMPERGSAPLRLGTRDLKHFLVGALDEVAIYPRVLTANEIRDHYQQGSGSYH